ncbi:hypothetical protein [Streptomyces sp. NA02536]|uniref:hypothetical protein n=1 Tax=Streptomyces sp. NA02536 TaxID=2742133 RepID=UPI00158FA917|nr:hypothetical protein [Streptomyces sp. NA02536]QKW04495.1 hypothetical protein HUT14_34025 [Streptomyces sp. NA02536]
MAALPVMVHPSRALDERAIAVPNMRVVTPDRLQALKQAIVAYAVALADGQGRWGDDQAVARSSLTTGSLREISFRSTPNRRVPHRAPDR